MTNETSRSTAVLVGVSSLFDLSGKTVFHASKRVSERHDSATVVRFLEDVTRGQIGGFVTAMLALAVSSVLVYQEHTSLAVVIMGLLQAGLIGAFVQTNRMFSPKRLRVQTMGSDSQNVE